MASNMFATILHKNTHRITAVLFYTLLEWILIVLLLLNSLFSYIISKFASYFGLQTPCLWCSRLDHLIEPQIPANSYTSLVCEAHACEISILSYCSDHHKLSEAQGMCEDCSSSSRPLLSRRDGRTAFFSLGSSDGSSKMEVGAKDLKCSCCGVSLDEGFGSPYLLFKPSWGNLVKEKGVEEEICGKFNDVDFFDPLKDESSRDLGEDDMEISTDQMAENQKLSVVSADITIKRADEMGEEGEKDAVVKPDLDPLEDCSSLSLKGNNCIQSCDENVAMIQVYCRDDPLEIPTLHFEQSSCGDRLVPIEMIDSMTTKNQEDEGILNDESDLHKEVTPHTSMEIGLEGKEEKRPIKLESSRENESSLVFSVKESGELVEEISDCDEFVVAQATRTLPGNRDENEANIKHRGGEDHSELIIESEMKPENPMTEVHLDKQTAAVEVHLSCPSMETLPRDESSCDELVSVNIQGADHAKDLVEDGGGSTIVCQNIPLIDRVGQIEEVDEEKVPQTPTYLESIHNLPKKLFFGKKELGSEPSNGGVVGDIECGEVTLDHLKSALTAERKALSALYAELEEERSASAIATNQTMAMITRLQEEKAAMQMEALQYQRMMEEQSEYDQEAFQLLNELIVKREKENQELEKELELYRKKVLHYEAKEKRMMRKKTSNEGNQTSSTSSSAGDSDELSIDLTVGDESFDGFQESAHNAPSNEVVNSGVLQESAKHLTTLDESLADFEEERLSILEQLKTLEEKLMTLDNEEQPFEDVNSSEHVGENGAVGTKNYEFCSPIENGITNGISGKMDANGRHHYERRNVGSKALLPLFDAIDMECEERPHEENVPSVVVSQRSISKIAYEKKLALEEEVDHVYERLQALEADREFLKHCINSLKKGDKGMDLLQEILQHLRDLRTVELRVKNTSDSPS